MASLSELLFGVKSVPQQGKLSSILNPAKENTGFSPAPGAGAVLSPFNPAIHKPKDIGLGGPSTEYLSTEILPNGEIANYPTIWWNESGDPVLLSPQDAMSVFLDYEQKSGKTAPRFKDIESAVEAAKARSKFGGASFRGLFE